MKNLDRLFKKSKLFLVDVYHRSDIRPHIWLYLNLTLFSFQGTLLRFAAPAALCDAYICYHFLTHCVNIYFLTFLVFLVTAIGDLFIVP